MSTTAERLETVATREFDPFELRVRVERETTFGDRTVRVTTYNDGATTLAIENTHGIVLHQMIAELRDTDSIEQLIGMLRAAQRDHELARHE
ncbi:hypothetical protein [Microbacterium sp.]|uniref:hypothetical protein n=1 Tax=Microbacterium sp. TaxID=51671 RepID=UPI002629637B|nr:hypothetical protein [Microbacterium sp.]